MGERGWQTMCVRPLADDLCFPSDEPMGERGWQTVRAAFSR